MSPGWSDTDTHLQKKICPLPKSSGKYFLLPSHLLRGGCLLQLVPERDSQKALREAEYFVFQKTSEDSRSQQRNLHMKNTTRMSGTRAEISIGNHRMLYAVLSRDGKESFHRIEKSSRFIPRELIRQDRSLRCLTAAAS